jgi:mRNA-degrading endonuclease toxin of MazEF toxin-antitoxin module
VPLPQPFPGLVIHYSYLWHDEHRRGLEEGVKDRPCVIVSASPAPATDILVNLVPITHRAPGDAADAVELSLPIKRHLGMDDDRSWIMVTEVNRFRWPGPDLRPIPGKATGNFTYGVVPPKLLAKIKAGILDAAGNRSLRTTAR